MTEGDLAGDAGEDVQALSPKNRSGGMPLLITGMLRSTGMSVGAVSTGMSNGIRNRIAIAITANTFLV